MQLDEQAAGRLEGALIVVNQGNRGVEPGPAGGNGEDWCPSYAVACALLEETIGLCGPRWLTSLVGRR